MSAAVPSLLLRSGINYLLRHPWQLLLALVGISMGVALILAVDIANNAAKTSFEHSAEQIRGTATHRIVSDLGKIDEEIYVDLFTSPGMPPMAPVITAKVRIKGFEDRFQLIGIDTLAEFNFRRSLAGDGSEGPPLDQWLSEPSAALITSAAAQYLDVDASGQLLVSHKGKGSTLDIKTITELDSQSSRSIIFVDIATAQQILGQPGYISYIDVLIENDESSFLTSQLPETVNLVDISQQTESILGLSAAFELNLTAMSLLSMLVGVFLIYNAISFSIVQRRNLFGRLRSLGVTAGQLYKVVLLEALILAIVGSLIGLLLGIWLGQQLTAIVASTISELYYEINAQAISVTGLSLLKAGFVGVLSTLAAAWIPAMQASRTKPLTTLSRASFEQAIQKHVPGLALLGLGIFVAGMMTAFLLPGGVVVGFVGLFIIVIGLVLTIPWLLSRLSRSLAQCSGNLTWQMSVKDLDRHISRLATATAALMLALSTSVGIAIMVDSMRSTVTDWLHDLLTGDLYIAAKAFEDSAYLPGKTVDKLIRLKTVEDYSLYRNYRLEIAGRKSYLIASRLAEKSKQGFEFIQGNEKQAWESFDQGAVIISEPLAYRMQLVVGDSISLLTPAGAKPFKVAAVFRDFASEHGRLFMPLDTFRSNWQEAEVNTIALFAAGIDTVQLEKQIYQQLEDPDQIVITRSTEVIDESLAVFDRTFKITEVLRLLSIFVAFIGIFSALMAILLERKKEFAVLRALGLTQKQISRLIVIESMMLGFIAALLAIPTGLLMAWVLTDVIQLRAFGWSMPFQISLEPMLIAALLGVIAALLAALYPAWLASRRNPAPYLRED